MFRRFNETCFYLGFNDFWLRVFGVPIIGFLIPITFLNYQWKGWTDYTTFGVLSIMYTFIYWEGARGITILFRRRFPQFKDTQKRLLFKIPTILFFAIVVVGILFSKYICSPMMQQFGAPPFDNQSIIAATFITLFCLAIYEGVYFYNQLKASIIEKEKAKRDHLQSQLEGLRNQVNPHFLFNSLNTLVNIIQEDPTLATRFLNQLAHVYRYILEVKEAPLVPLSEELDFLQSYVFLQQERFKGNLIVNIDVPTSYLQHQIVPFSMQILFENAVKHNIISAKRPLHIQVYINEEDKLVVTNNLQRKQQVMDSTKVGLANIKSRYRLITNELVVVQDDGKYFNVLLPLINSAYQLTTEASTSVNRSLI